LILADGTLVVLGERGRLVMTEATPEGFRELRAVQLVRGRTWTGPTLADGTLYVRTETELLALDLGAGGAS